MAIEQDEPLKRPRRRPTPTTDEAYEARLIGKAYALAEKQLDDGTASSQVVTHLMKAGSIREQLEKERLRKENLLIEAKIKNMEQLEDVLKMMTEAKDAMMSYRVDPPRLLDD